MGSIVIQCSSVVGFIIVVQLYPQMLKKEESFRVRMTPDEKARLEYEANKKDVSMSQVLRDFIRQLPAPKSA
jgi:hypothetical protein